MGKIQNLRFIKHKTIQSLDLVLLFLSAGYLYMYFQEGHGFSMVTPIFIIVIHLFNLLSKTTGNGLFASFAYGLSGFAILFLHYPIMSEMKWLFIVPFIIFFYVLFSSLTSTLLSGFLFGYWLLLFYFAFSSPLSGLNTVFAIYTNDRVVVDHLYFLIITAIIFFLFTKVQPYQRTTRTMKVSQLFVWLVVPFVLTALDGPDSAEGLKIAGVYFVLTILMNKSLKTDDSRIGSFAYAIVTFIFCLYLKQFIGLENIYFQLIVPLIVLILVNYFSISVRFLIGVLFAFWCIQFIHLYQNLEQGFVSALDMILSENGIMDALKFFWIQVLIGVIWSVKTSLIDRLINTLERSNQRVKHRERLDRIKQPFHDQQVNQNTKGWEEL